MQQEEAARTLREVEALRRRTGSVARSFWFPMVLFGALSLASAPLCAISGDVAIGLFWTIAGPTGGVLTVRYYRKRESTLGVRVASAPYLLTGAAITAGATLFGVLGSGVLQSAGPALVIAAGYLVFARLDHSRALALVAVGLGLVTGAVIILDLNRACSILLLVYGAVMTTTGLMFRQAELRADDD